MSIGISDEHVELAASLRKWAADLTGRELARAAEGDADAIFEPAWRAAQEMGIATIGLPEEAGGGGGSVLDVAVALEACAHELVPGPLLGPAVASLVVPGVSAEAVVGIGLGDVVSDLPSATHVLLADDAGAWSLYPRAAVEATSSTGLDLSRRFGTARVVDESAGVAVPDLTTDRLRRTTVTLAAAEAAGVARWCLATAVEYAKVREQFGQKIGAFQAIKHLCAEMLETAEAVTAAAWDAAGAAEEAEEQWAFAADVAAAVALDGGSDAAAERLTAAAVTGTRRQVSLDLSGRDEPVRDEVRATVERIAALPADERRAAFVETGYLTPHWPAPYGLGADAVTQVVIDQELARAGVTRPDIVIAGWALPTILEHGTDEQRERFVTPSLLGDVVWCQLFSEPGAGSDLASLRTRAEKVDGGWRLTGQKVWNSVAERADWGICLARTDPDAPKHKGISYFLVDMRNTPGIEVRPLREITGKALFNEVFLDDVFVPDELVVGAVDDGWRLARTTLANERVAMASARLSQSTERAITLAARGLDVAQTVAVGHSIALATVCGLLGVRATLRSLAGQGPGAESSVAKLLGVRNRQDGAELVVSLHGDAILVDDSDEVRADVWEMLNTRCLSIAGGTTRVLRNVAGERILGLPR